ncbi:MAG: hypothetical protein IPI87_02020 [Betaproteobacteria bacterium]|nr:hypothetical protein [Betaproteobacteria bacterium]
MDWRVRERLIDPIQAPSVVPITRDDGDLDEIEVPWFASGGGNGARL